jgi:hypothetical protein
MRTTVTYLLASVPAADLLTRLGKDPAVRRIDVIRSDGHRVCTAPLARAASAAMRNTTFLALRAALRGADAAVVAAEFERPAPHRISCATDAFGRPLASRGMNEEVVRTRYSRTGGFT